MLSHDMLIDFLAAANNLELLDAAIFTQYTATLRMLLNGRDNDGDLNETKDHSRWSLRGRDTVRDFDYSSRT